MARGEVRRVCRRHFGDRDAHARQRLREQLVGAAVERVAGHDVVAALAAVQHRGGRCRHAAGQGQRRFALLQIGHLDLERGLRGVAQPRVDVAGVLAAEDGGSVLRVLEGEGRTLENGRADGADRTADLVLVEVLLAVDAKRREPRPLVALLLVHQALPFAARRRVLTGAAGRARPPAGRCRRRASTRSSRSQVNPSSSRPKCP